MGGTEERLLLPAPPYHLPAPPQFSKFQ